MLSARFRRYSDLIVVPLGNAVAKTGVEPNVLTLAGLLFSIAAAGAFAYGNLVYAFMLLFLGSLFDVLDGAVAKAQRKVTKFGGYLDSVADRYADAFILIGIAMYLNEHHVLIMVVIVGSILVSYSRARAETVIDKCDVGLAERSERLIILMVATLLAIAGVNLFYEALVLLAVLTHLTVLQRILYTRKEI
jgi:archaetidylinositol phosphate synthase